MVTKSQILDREPKEIACIVQKKFIDEGIDLCLEHRVIKAHHDGKKFIVTVQDKEKKSHEIRAEQLLISVGRKANLKDLNLEAAKITTTDKGIVTDDYMRTSQKHIFAIGDICGPPFFTHLAESHGRTVLTTLLSPFGKKWTKQQIPRVTYTDPEIASVGLSYDQAVEKYSEKKIVKYELSFEEVDRAICQGRTEGVIQIITKKWTGKILGANIVGPRAGEMLPEIGLAMMNNIPLRKLTPLIHAYPTYNQGIRKIADQWLIKTIFPVLKRLFKR